MKKIQRWLCGAYALSTLIFMGCGTTQKATAPSLAYNNARNPQFIDDISLGGGASSGIRMRVVDNYRNKTHKDIPVLNPSETNALQVKYGSMLGVLPQYINNLSLYRFIDEWYGVAYRLGGSDQSGIDCSAFVQRLYEQVFGINVLRTAIEQFHHCNMLWKNSTDMKEGDLVFFRIHSKRITHVGIYLMNNFFVHASASQGVTISSLDDRYWRKYYAGAGQVPHGEG